MGISFMRNHEALQVQYVSSQVQQNNNVQW